MKKKKFHIDETAIAFAGMERSHERAVKSFIEMTEEEIEAELNKKPKGEKDGTKEPKTSKKYLQVDQEV